MMISDNWGEFLLPHLRKIFEKHQQKMRDFLPVIYNVETSTKAQEFTHGIGSLGLMDEWSDSGNQVSYETVNPGYKQTYTHRKFSKGIKIERELLDDAQYVEVKKRVNLLAQSEYYTKQYYAAYPFNNCTGFLGPDGKAMCATDHPLGPNNSTTWSNLATGTDLDPNNVETIRNYMKGWKDDKGNLLAVNPDTLIVPPALRKKAIIIADTNGEPDTADNNVNIWKGSLNVIEWDFLNTSTMWFMVDMTRMKTFLTWYNRRKAKLESEKMFDTEIAKFKCISRFSFGFDDASFVYGVSTS